MPDSHQYTNPYSAQHSASPQVAPHHRLLLGATSIIALVAGAALPTTPATATPPALDVCAAATPGDTVTIGPDAGEYPVGIECSVHDVTLVLQGDSDTPAIINTTVAAGISVPPAGLDGPVTLIAETGSAVTTDGAGLNGIQIGTDAGPVTVDMAGDINASGDYSVGILVVSDTATVDIDVSGSVTTHGDEYSIGYSPAIHVHGNTSAVNIDVSGDLTTSTYNSAGIDVGTYTGPIDIDISGSVSTEGSQSAGVYAISGYGDIFVSVDEGASITTSGASAEGVRGESFEGLVGVGVAGTIATSGEFASGVMALTGSTYGVLVDVEGDITTTGDGADGVHAHGGGGLALVVVSGSIATTGAAANGIEARSDGFGAMIDVAGDISTQGNYATGIEAHAQYGGADIDVSGSVTTVGNGSYGVHAISDHDDVTVSIKEEANVRTLGEGAIGIRGQSQYGNATVNVDGAVDTTEAYAYGVVVLVSGDNDATVNIGGSVTTAGDNAHGVRLNGFVGLATANVTGEVVTVGHGSGGVGVQVEDGTASVNVSGSIATSGDVATGASADAKYGHADIDVSGSIVTAGNYSTGVSASSKYAASVNVGGSISTSGTDATGVYASSSHFGALGEQTVSVTVNDVSTTGNYSKGVSTWSETGDTQVTVTGEVSTTGNYSHGLYIRSNEGNISVNVSGAVVASGAHSDGVYASSLSGTVAITVDGSVVGGIDGAGIRIVSAASSLTTIGPDGTVGAGSGVAIIAAPDEVLVADDTLIVHGAIQGSVSLNDGSDPVSFTATADLSGLGVVDGGDDHSVEDGFIDTLTFMGATGTVLDTTFINFEDITLDGADLTISYGDGTPLQTSYAEGMGLHLVNGSTLDLSSGVDVWANVDIDGTSTLQTGGSAEMPHMLDGDVSLMGSISMFNHAGRGYTNITGNMVSDGGSLIADVCIGESGVPFHSDILVINGDLTGTLTLDVQTHWSGKEEVNGPLVTVLGDASEGDVVLLGRVDQGINLFGLEQDDQSWTLVNTGIFEQLSAYENITSLLGTQNISSMGTLRQRVGAASIWDPSTRLSEGLWFRGQYDDSKGDAGIGEHAGAFSADRLFGQLGFDVFSHEGDNTTIIASVFGTLGSSDMDNHDMAGAATGGANINDYGVGLGLTVYHGGNFFLDAVFQALWQDIDFKSANGVTAETDANSLMSSLEVGYNFDLSGGWHLSPEAQIVFGSLDLDDYIDSSAILVTHNEKAKSVVGRLGITLEHNDGGKFIGYLKLAISNEFKGEGDMVFNEQTVSWDYSGTSGEVQLGGSYKVGERSHIFAEFTYADKFSGRGLRNVGGKAGVKIGF